MVLCLETPFTTVLSGLLYAMVARAIQLSAEAATRSGRVDRLERLASAFLPDQRYRPSDAFILAKAFLLGRLLPSDERLASVIEGVISELLAIARYGNISHFVIHGSKRRTVLVRMLCSRQLPASTPIILREREADRLELIAEHVASSLPLDVLRALPQTMDLAACQQGAFVPEVAKSLYVSGRLIGPYQIDTDRFPFTARFC